MHRGTPDGHITSEKPEHNRECRRVLRHVLALELHRAPSFRDLEACIAPSRCVGCQTSFQSAP